MDQSALRSRSRVLRESSKLVTESFADIAYQDLCTRTAAVFSMRAFFESLLDCGFQLPSDPQILGVYLALYDTLVDDDEDVRDQGARVVSTILSVAESEASDKSTTTLSLSPPAAKEVLLRYLCESYRNSMPLCVESIRRLTGMESAPGSALANKQDGESQTKQGKSVLHLRPIAELFLEAQATSNVVFVEERQNLYIDTVSEAESWSELLSRLDPGAWPQSLAFDLEIWIVEGLAHILVFLRSSIDGALSPTSKPEVFAIFTRVFLAAKVLILRPPAASSKGRSNGSVCVGLLEGLLDLGRSRLFHDLLLLRIETILEEVGQLRM